MTHEALAAAEPKMARAMEAMERDFAAIRTGRASTALVEHGHREPPVRRFRATSQAV